MPGQARAAYDAWKRDRQQASTRFLDETAFRLEVYLRTPGTAPWYDRTRDARSGLVVETSPLRGFHGYWEYEIEIGYAVDYGYWLETKDYTQVTSTGISNRQRRQDTSNALADFFGEYRYQSGWGRDALLNPTMELLMPYLDRELDRIWSEDAPSDYEPRFSGVAGVSYDGNDASVRSWNYTGPFAPPSRGGRFARGDEA